MGQPAKVLGNIEIFQSDFDIVMEYTFMNAHRKSVLCDQLFVEGLEVFQDTVELLWPTAKAHDCRKLAKHLYQQRRFAH